MDYIDNQKLIEDVEMLMRIPELRAALYHKVEEYKNNHAKRLEEYQEIENMVDPGKKEKTGEPTAEIRFEIRKNETGWVVNPVDFPRDIVKHITSMNLTPGIIKMQKFKISNGRMIDLSFEMQTRNCFTGSIIEKKIESPGKEIPAKQVRAADSTDNLKTFITYLLNNKTLYNWMMSEFFGNWKPLIDSGCIKTKTTER